MQSYSLYRHILAPGSLILGFVIASCQGGPTSPEDRFALSASELVFSDQEQQQVSIKNLASEPLEWRIEGSTASWLNGAPGSGVLEPHGTGSMTVRIVRAAVPQGNHSATLRIGAGGQSRLLKVSVQPASGPAASLVPNQLSFGTSGVSAVVDVVNSGATSLSWTLNGPSWMTITPSSGNVEPGSTRHVTLTAVRAGLAEDHYQGTLQLASNGGSATASVSLDVEVLSSLRLDPGTLDFGTSTTSKTVRIVNDGDSAIDWSADPSTAWISLSPDSGRLPPKLSQLLTVEISRSNLFHGTNQGAIQFSSSAGSPSIIINASIVPAGGSNPAPSHAPKLSISPVRLDFGAVSTELVLVIQNEGDQPLDWSGDPGGSWISLPTASGRVAPHSYATVPVRISRTNLLPGAYQSFVQFESNGGSAVTTVAAVVNSPGAPPTPPGPPPPSPPPGGAAARINVSPTSLHFGNTATELSLRIRNDGTAALTWLAQNASPWVTFPGTEGGQLAPGAFTDFSVRVSRSELSTPGEYVASVQLTSNGGNLTVPISLQVPSQTPTEGPKLVVTPTSIDFGETATEMMVRVKNDGTSSLTWTAQSSNTWLLLTELSGQLAPNALVDLPLRIVRSGLSTAGVYDASVGFTSNGGNSTVEVSARVTAPTPPPPPGDSKSVNVRDYGALGDGLHDDSGAFRQALTALGTSGGTIYVPAGIYNLKPSPGVPNRGLDLTERSNITVYGDGPNLTSLRMPSSNYQGDTHIVYMLQSTGITFRDLAFDGNRLNASFSDEQNHCVEIWRGSADILFERTVFHHCRGDGIRLLGPITGSGPWTERVTIRSSRFEDNGRSGVAVQRGVRYLNILNNTFDRISDQSIDMEPTGTSGLPPTDIRIEGNIIRHTTHQWAVTVGGISSDDFSQRVTFRNNQVINGAVAFGKTTDILVEGNTIVGDPYHGALRLARNVTDVSIVGNVISGFGGGDEGLVQIVSYNSAYPSNVYVRNNTITASAGQTGVFVRDPLGTVEFVDNEITGKGSGAGIDIVMIAKLGVVRAGLTVEGNTILNFTRSIKLGTSGDGLAGVSIRRNSMDHLQIPTTITFGILFDKTGPYEAFATVQDNTFGPGIRTRVLVRD